MDKKYLSTSALAELMGISRIAVFKQIKNGKIPATRIGHNYFIEAENVNAILGKELSPSQKPLIEDSVKRTVKQYSEALDLLGKE